MVKSLPSKQMFRVRFSISAPVLFLSSLVVEHELFDHGSVVRFHSYELFRQVAQLVEHVPEEYGVGGSNPSQSTKIIDQ